MVYFGEMLGSLKNLKYATTIKYSVKTVLSACDVFLNFFIAEEEALRYRIFVHTNRPLLNISTNRI